MRSRLKTRFKTTAWKLLYVFPENSFLLGFGWTKPNSKIDEWTKQFSFSLYVFCQRSEDPWFGILQIIQTDLVFKAGKTDVEPITLQ